MKITPFSLATLALVAGVWFGSEANARRLKLQVSQIGYSVIVTPVETNGRNLHAVRVVGYSSKKAADQAGRNIKKKLGIDYRVLYRPKS